MKKQIIKKTIAICLTASLLIFAAGCSNNANSNEPSLNADTSSNGVKTIAIVQHIDNPAFDDMREGFIEELEAKGYGKDKVKIINQNAQGDASNLNTIVQQLISDKVDIIAPIATPATQVCVAAGSDIPIFFTAVSDPVRAGIISDMAHPDKNATGTSNKIPVDKIFALSNKLTPKVKTFGFIYNTGEENSVSTVEAAKKYLDEKGLKYEEAVVTNSSEVQQAAQNLFPKVDALFIPNDAMVQSAMPLIGQVTREFKKPTYACSAATVASGAMATVAISDKEIGALTADMVISYLEGKKLADIPAIVVPASHDVLNEDLINDIGITFPADATKDAELIKEKTNQK